MYVRVSVKRPKMGESNVAFLLCCRTHRPQALERVIFVYLHVWTRFSSDSDVPTH